MKNGQWISVFVLPLAALPLFGCLQTQRSQTVTPAKFTDLLFDGAQSVPGAGLAWDMTADAFLAQVDHPEVFDPDSEAYDEYRSSYNEANGLTLYSPLTLYQPDGYPQPMESAFTFDGDGLFQAGYGWTFDASETDALQTSLTLLIDDLNTHPAILPNPEAAPPDFGDGQTGSYQAVWSLADEDKTVQLTVGSVKDQVSATVMVYLNDRFDAHYGG